MCGIAGLIRWSSLDAADDARAARFPGLQQHRGPDGSGTYRDVHCTLAQSRLSLIGPDAMALPHRSACGRYVLVYNGEVYNYREFHPESDTAAVLEAWIRWGPAMLGRLNGMFSFFIWDSLARRGFAAVDPLGVKPFLFHREPGGDGFAFASEASVLLDSGIVRFSPNEVAIAETLVAPYFSSALRLPFAGIERLQPGHCLTISEGRFEIRRYYEFRHAEARNGEDADATIIDRLAAALEAAVPATQQATSTVGSFLSGGVDSSLIAALAGPASPAFTIAFEGDEHQDFRRSLIVKSADLPYARSAAAHVGCPHHVVAVDDARYEVALEHTLGTNDLICAWEQEISQHLLAEAAARQGLKAVLVGDAADETHFGYSFLLRASSPSQVIDFFGIPPLRRAFFDEDPLVYWDAQYRRLAEQHGYSWDGAANQRLAMSCLIRQLWLTRLLHNGDIHLMRHSVEGRVPFADVRLLELAQAVPVELGLRDGIEKWHLRKTAERYLPRAIAWRPKSALNKNLHAQQVIYRQFTAAWRTHGALLEPYVDADAVSRLGPPVDDRATGICFRLLALLKWLERFACKPNAPSPSL